MKKEEKNLSKKVKFIGMGRGPLLEEYKDYAEKSGISYEFTGALDYEVMVGRMCSCDAVINCLRPGAAQSITNKVGDYALSGSSSRNSKSNVAIGKNSGIKLNGNGNTFIGHQSGYRMQTGDYNTMIGFNSLGKDNGFYNICIGNNTEFAENVSNTIAIGREIKTTKSNQMILGSTHITEVVLCGNRKINFNADGTVTWETI